MGQIPGWEYPLKKAMAPHSSTLAWKIPWRVEDEVVGIKGTLNEMMTMLSTALEHSRSVKSKEE